jgi:hypothetical protein
MDNGREQSNIRTGGIEGEFHPPTIHLFTLCQDYPNVSIGRGIPFSTSIDTVIKSFLYLITALLFEHLDVFRNIRFEMNNANVPDGFPGE